MKVQSITYHCTERTTALVKLIRTIPMKKLFSALRDSTLENAPETICMFHEAHFEMRKIFPREINLSTFYLLKDTLAKQRAIRRILLEQQGIDTLRLETCLELQDDDGNLWTMMPPIVEVLEEEVVYPQRLDNVEYPDKIRILAPTALDGHHRLWIADQDEPEEKVNVVYITGSKSWENPFYAYPNNWRHVEVYASKEDVRRKKLYRRNPPYTRLTNLRVLGFTGRPGSDRKK